MTLSQLHNAALQHIKDSVASAWSANKLYVGPSNAEYARNALPIAEVVLDAADVTEETFGQDLVTLTYIITGVFLLNGENRDTVAMEKADTIRAVLLTNSPGTMVKVTIEPPVLLSGPDADSRVRYMISCGIAR